MIDFNHITFTDTSIGQAIASIQIYHIITIESAITAPRKICHWKRIQKHRFSMAIRLKAIPTRAGYEERAGNVLVVRYGLQTLISNAWPPFRAPNPMESFFEGGTNNVRSLSQFCLYDCAI